MYRSKAAFQAASNLRLPADRFGPMVQWISLLWNGPFPGHFVSSYGCCFKGSTLQQRHPATPWSRQRGHCSLSEMSRSCVEYKQTPVFTSCFFAAVFSWVLWCDKWQNGITHSLIVQTIVPVVQSWSRCLYETRNCRPLILLEVHAARTHSVLPTCPSHFNHAR